MNDVILSINTKKDLYESELLVLRYFRNKSFESYSTIYGNDTPTSVKEYWNQLLDSEFMEERKCPKYEIKNSDNPLNHK